MTERGDRDPKRIYLALWPDGSATLLSAESFEHSVERLDEWPIRGRASRPSLTEFTRTRGGNLIAASYRGLRFRNDASLFSTA